MMRVVGREEQKRNELRLNRFCKENFIIMFNFMIAIENDRYQNQGKCSECQQKFWKELKKRGIIREEKQ